MTYGLRDLPFDPMGRPPAQYTSYDNGSHGVRPSARLPQRTDPGSCYAENIRMDVLIRLAPYCGAKKNLSTA
jgi:hypothetical protein